MDLAAGLSNLSQSQTLARVQTAVARKVMETQKQQGSAAIQLLNAATEGASKAGQNLAAASIGLGRNLDVRA